MAGECIFCRIVKGEIPSARLAETKNAIAFLDIQPANKGHALVIPKKHYERLPNVPEDELKEVIVLAQRVSVAVEKATSAHGVSVIQLNGKAAGQEVPHLHFHVIPRFDHDAHETKWKREEYKKETKEMDEMKEKIRSFL